MAYRTYSQYLKEQYGEKTYKIPIHLPVTCPNRDGLLGTGGCIYCGDVGAGFECHPAETPIIEQVTTNVALIRKKYKANKYIAYFQNYTNTYLPLARLLAYVEETVAAFKQADAELAELAISTRPDCLRADYVDAIKTVCDGHGVALTFELGLQSVNWHTLDKIARGHGLAEFVDAALILRDRNIPVCAHLIMDLPWDDMRDIEEAARLLTVLGVGHVKLHALYILKGTALGDSYESGEVSPLPVEDYIERVVRFIRLVSPDMVFHRLAGRAPESDTLYCNGGMSWWRIKEAIEERLVKEAIEQGDLCTYRSGPVLQKLGQS